MMATTSPGDEDDPREDYVRGYETLTPEQIVAIAASRVIIEQVKGMLMLVYGIDQDDAFELLRARARASQVKVRLLAVQLCEDLQGITRDAGVDLPSTCDRLLRTAHQRINPPDGRSLAARRADRSGPRPGPRPSTSQ